MTSWKYGAFAGALMVAAGAAPGVPARLQAQDRAPLFRAFDAGRGARIGVTVRDIEGEDAKQGKSGGAGVVVDAVTSRGPGDTAGLKVGDTITEFDGERVRSALQFSRLVQETPVGRNVQATVLRGGQRTSVTITPEPRDTSDDFNMRLLQIPRAAPVPRPALPPRTPRPPSMDRDFELPGLLRPAGRRLGVTIESLDDQLAGYFGVKEGVLVKSVQDGSAAQKAGIKAGDVITTINGSNVQDSSDVNRALDRLDTSGEFTIGVVRDKKAQSLKGKLDARETRTRTRTIV